MKRYLKDVIHYYLPYEVKYENSASVLNVVGIQQDSFMFHHLYESRIFYGAFHTIKPYLRPLSDLKKEDVQNKFFEVFGGAYSSKIAFAHDVTQNLINTPPILWSLSQIELALSLHLDLFGLIESNQAIDINTL